MCSREILPDHEKIPVTLLGDLAYHLHLFCMKEYPNTWMNDEVILSNMLRSVRNPTECAFGHLKVRWEILNKRNDMRLSFIPSIIYARCVIHNICELQGMNVEDDVLAQQIARDRLAQPENAPDRLCSFNTAKGAYERNIITSFYKEHIPH